MERDLAENWSWVPIESVATVKGGYGFPKEFQGHSNLTYPFIKVSDMNLPGNELYVTRAINTVDETILNEIGAKLFPAGTVIFPKIGGAIATNKKRILATPATFDNNIMGLSPNDSVSPRWLCYFLQSIDLMTLAQTTAYPSIRQSTVKELQIPLAPPIDQARIVSRVDALLAELRESKEIHKHVVEDTERLMEAVSAEVFPGIEEELPSGWSLKTVKDISEKPQYGYTQSAKTEPGGPKFLRISDIQDGQVNWETVPYCECDEETLEKYRLRSGDLVFARSGATTGKTYLVRDPPEAVFASYLIRLRIRQYAVPEFVYWFFQSPYYWAQITPRGAAQPNVNATVLSALRLPVPEDARIQDRIIAYLDNVQDEVRAMQDIQERDRQLLEQLEQAILAQAFQGGL